MPVRLPVVVADTVALQQFSDSIPGEVCVLCPIDGAHSNFTWKHRPLTRQNEHHEQERIIFLGPKPLDILRSF